MNASILTIGTELTTGQIINRNATTLSQKLNAHGIIVNIHLTVPDHKKTILNSLNFIENQLDDSDLLFITGGLGPTSDDFTRDVLAEWTGTVMKFDQASWDHLVERLNTRGFKVREMQKQQCYFPENSEILFNTEGTANAYKFSFCNKTVYVLPGPPREIEAIWKNHIQSHITEITKNLNKQIIKSWDTIGIGESEVAFAVEQSLKDRPKMNSSAELEIGYRVHLPYVEVKLSFLARDSEKWAPWVKKVDTILEKITVAKDFSDAVLICAEKIKALDFTFYDFVTNGYLHGRLAQQLNLLENWSFKQSVVAPSVDFFSQEDNFLAICPFQEDKCIVIGSINGNRLLKTIEAPMKAPLMFERRRQYFAELALIEISRLH